MKHLLGQLLGSDAASHQDRKEGASSCNKQLARGVTGSLSWVLSPFMLSKTGGQRRGGADEDCSVRQSSSDKDAGEHWVWNFLLRRSGRFTALMPALLSLKSFQHYILAQLHRLNFHKELQFIRLQGRLWRKTAGTRGIGTTSKQHERKDVPTLSVAH